MDVSSLVLKLIQGKLGIVLLLGLFVTAGCVARYPPLDHVHPLSKSCNDYARFAVSIIKQREQGFSKRATVNIAGFSVGNSEEQRAMLYARYKPIFEIIYADYHIYEEGIRAAGLAICEQQLTKNWSLLVEEDYKAAADVIHLCQDANASEVDMKNCILARASGKPDPELERPPF